MTPTEFRALFPEFADTARYSDAAVQFRLNIAVQLVNAERWGQMADQGVGWVAAHFLSLMVRAVKYNAFGKAPGQSSGVVSSKSVDGVSVSYDTQLTTLEGGGHWNATVYGVQYLQFARLFGAGPLQVQSAPANNISASAWTGPPLSPW